MRDMSSTDVHRFTPSRPDGVVCIVQRRDQNEVCGYPAGHPIHGAGAQFGLVPVPPQPAESWRLTQVRGWGPDYSNTDVVCAATACPWERTWEDWVSLGEIVDTVTEHMKTAH